LTGTPKSDYVVYRFGLYKHGTTGTEVPGIYTENGEISNAYDFKSAAITYYDLLY